MPRTKSDASQKVATSAEPERVSEQTSEEHPTRDIVPLIDVNTPLPTLEHLFKSGAHFGHRKERRHPRMDEYTYTYKEGMGIIDLKKTLDKLEEAKSFVRALAGEGKTVLFVGTKKHVKSFVHAAAEICEAPFVNERWLGGTFTNSESMRGRIRYYEELEHKIQTGELAQYTKFEQSKKQEEYEKLTKKIGGIRTMKELPGAIFVVDMKQDSIAVSEALHVNVPVVAIVDTNDDPTHVDYPIPANNDAVSSVKLVLTTVCQAYLEGKKDFASKKDKAEEIARKSS